MAGDTPGTLFNTILHLETPKWPIVKRKTSCCVGNAKPNKWQLFKPHTAITAI